MTRPWIVVITIIVFMIVLMLAWAKPGWGVEGWVPPHIAFVTALLKGA